MGEPADSAVRLTASVRGYVQGVGFRWSTMTVAQSLGLTGAAENRMDGTVLVTAEGSRQSCEKLLGWLRGEGPRTVRVPGRVDEVDPRWSPATGEFRRFTAY